MQVDLNSKPPYFEQVRVENKERGQLGQLAISLLDQKQSFDPSFLKQLSDKIAQTRVEFETWEHPDNSGFSGVKVEVKHDVYRNHPESKYSPLATMPKKRHKEKFNTWRDKFEAILGEKPSQDTSNMAMANIANLIKKDYQALLQESEKALERYENNQEARIENFIARYHLSKDFDAHALELYNFRLELMKIEVSKPAFFISLEFLYDYFNEVDKAVIHDCIASNRFNSVLEEFVMKLIDYYDEKEDFVNFHTDLLSTPDFLYLFWVCECLADNMKILDENNKLSDFPKVKKFIENGYKSTGMDSADLQVLATELCCVEAGHVNLEWQLSKNISKALLYFALFEIEDEYSRSIYE